MVFTFCLLILYTKLYSNRVTLFNSIIDWPTFLEPELCVSWIYKSQTRPFHRLSSRILNQGKTHGIRSTNFKPSTAGTSYVLLLLKKQYIASFTCVHVCACTTILNTTESVPRSEDRRTTFGTQFFPSTMWVPGFNLFPQGW